MPSVQPHPDLELGLPRSAVSYLVATPDSGLTSESGVIIYLHGFGGDYDDAYAQKLLPKLANQTGHIAVSLGYHCSRMMASPNYLMSRQFLQGLDNHFGIKVQFSPEQDQKVIIPELFSVLSRAGLTHLPDDTHLTINSYGDYMSFGLLPALDVLSVLHKILQDYPVRTDQIHLLGTSYGGYIALFLAKIAPWTFASITDNSGFSGPDDAMATIYGGLYQSLCGIRCLCINQNRFLGEGEGSRQFSRARRAIRELDRPEHWAHGGCGAIYSYHSEQDQIADCSRKRAAGLTIRRYRQFDLHVVTEQDVDGRLFKNTDHAMNASLYELCLLSLKKYATASGNGNHGEADFERGSVFDLTCDNKVYRFCYSRSHGVSLEIVQS